MRDTEYATELASASISWGNSEGRIEKLFIKKTSQIEIRFSWWQDGRLIPRPLDLPEADLITLMKEAINKGVLSPGFPSKLSENSPGAAKQIILNVGAEGGSLTLWGIKDGLGNWLFLRETDETTLLAFVDDLDPSLLRSETEMVDDWDKALNLLDKNPWIYLAPLEVHQEFRVLVWEALLDRGKRLYDNDEVQRWFRSLGKWHRVCFVPTER